MSATRAERAATPIGEYRRPTASEGALSHQFLPAMGTRVATHRSLASFRQGLPSSQAGKLTFASCPAWPDMSRTWTPLALPQDDHREQDGGSRRKARNCPHRACEALRVRGRAGPWPRRVSPRHDLTPPGSFPRRLDPADSRRRVDAGGELRSARQLTYPARHVLPQGADERSLRSSTDPHLLCLRHLACRPTPALPGPLARSTQGRCYVRS